MGQGDGLSAASEEEIIEKPQFQKFCEGYVLAHFDDPLSRHCLPEESDASKDGGVLDMLNLRAVGLIPCSRDSCTMALRIENRLSLLRFVILLE